LKMSDTSSFDDTLNLQFNWLNAKMLEQPDTLQVGFKIHSFSSANDKPLA
jgi:hypothetical protein